MGALVVVTLTRFSTMVETRSSKARFGLLREVAMVQASGVGRRGSRTTLALAVGRPLRPGTATERRSCSSPRRDRRIAISMCRQRVRGRARPRGWHVELRQHLGHGRFRRLR